MIQTALALLTTLFGVIGKVFEWLHERDMVNAGKVQAQLETLQQQVKDAQIAVAAREAVRAAAAAGKLPVDDPFQRD